MSKNKGANFERTMAKAFSSWSGKEFYRTPGSGNWSSQRLGQSAQVGDIVPPEDIVFPFSIELKHHEGISLDNYMMSNGEVPSFFAQCVGDAVRSQRIPMLITHSNYAPNYLSLPLSSKILKPFIDNNKPYITTKVKFQDYVSGEDVYMDIFVVILEDFFELYSVENFYKGYKVAFKYWYKEVSPDIKSRTTGSALMTKSDIDNIIDKL